MIEQYLAGSISQSLERIKLLKQIVHAQYPREYDGLRQICLVRLDAAASDLRRLSNESIVDVTLQSSRRVREFKRVVGQLTDIENVGVFALRRASIDDYFLNRLITEICRELSYPLIPPTVSEMSQDYFHIYPEFNLLCLPLIESHFLLHLPDIYHELCHPFHRKQNEDLPILARYHGAYKKGLFFVLDHFSSEAVVVDRLNRTAGKRLQLQLWQICWVKYWMEEFYCDLFGVLSVGPAYAWSHYHLCVKRGADPFHTPLTSSASHPADDARMRAIIRMLNALGGFDSATAKIEAAWADFIGMMRFVPSPEYLQCYTDKLLEEIVGEVKGVSDTLGINVVSSTEMSPTVSLLNCAWQQFWDSPAAFPAWEMTKVAALQGAFSKR